jgi:hypothetical protein
MCGKSDLYEHILVVRAGFLEGLIAVVGRIHRVQRRSATELLADRPQQVHLRQFVARPAEEEHRDRDGGEMVSPLRLRLSGLV